MKAMIKALIKGFSLPGKTEYSKGEVMELQVLKSALSDYSHNANLSPNQAEYLLSARLLRDITAEHDRACGMLEIEDLKKEIIRKGGRR